MTTIYSQTIDLVVLSTAKQQTLFQFGGGQLSTVVSILSSGPSYPRVRIMAPEFFVQEKVLALIDRTLWKVDIEKLNQADDTHMVLARGKLALQNA